MQLYLCLVVFAAAVMHLLFLMLFVLTLSAAASAKILAIAGAVYAVLQVSKKIFPAIGGPWALALNFGLSAIGFLITVPAANLVSIDTLVGLLMAVAASAGIHGTVKNLTPDSAKAA